MFVFGAQMVIMIDSFPASPSLFAVLSLFAYPVLQTILLFIMFGKIANYKIPKPIFPLLALFSEVSLWIALYVGPTVFSPITGRTPSSGMGMTELYISNIISYTVLLFVFYMFIRRRIKKSSK